MISTDELTSMDTGSTVVLISFVRQAPPIHFLRYRSCINQSMTNVKAEVDRKATAAAEHFDNKTKRLRWRRCQKTNKCRSGPMRFNYFVILRKLRCALVPFKFVAEQLR